MDKKAAIYCRIAGNSNPELKQIAIESQRQALERYAKEKGLTVVGYYEDIGYNGLNDDRPGLQHLMDDAKAGSFDAVLVYKLDRLFRQSMPGQKLPFRLISMLDARNELER